MTKLLKTLIVLVVLAASLLPLSPGNKVSASAAGCYVNTNNTVIAVPCTGIKANPDPTKCYRANGPGPAYSNIREVDCAVAQALDPGCYGPGQPAETLDCNSLKVLYPNAQIDASKCYASPKPPATGTLKEINCATGQAQGAVWKPQIPVGCPGGGAGPATPGTLKICDQIPAGCPGSKLAGPPSDPNACPYEALAPKPAATTSPPSPTTTPPVTQPNDNINPDTSTFSNTCGGQEVSAESNCIIKDINTVIDVLSAGVGIIVIITIITAGIQYIVAGGDPQKISQAKNRIRNAIIALLAFTFLFAFLQWVIPGGL